MGPARSLPFVAAISLSAFLLFQVQPILARQLLPLYGGTPALWSSCLLTFQTLLLVGYLYGWFLSRYSLQVQRLFHSLALIGAVATLSLSAPAISTGAQAHELQVALKIVSMVGLAYCLLSATSTLVQGWYVAAFNDQAPARLFALSNLASLGGLFAYPFVIEPNLSTEAQATLWSYGFALAAGLLITSAFVVPRNATRARDPEQWSSSDSRSWILWIFFSALGSSLLYAVTNLLCQELAPVPFLWVVPLGIYLLSFVLTFESNRWYRRRLFVSVLFVAALILCDPYFSGPQASPLLACICGLITLAAGTMVCHGEIARRLPPRGQLPTLYLFLAAGGAAGGVFVALLAPRLFTSYSELQLTLFLICASSVALVRSEVPQLGRGASALLILLIGGALLLNDLQSRKGSLHMSRNFFGTLRIAERPATAHTPAIREQYQGRILHGLQLLDPGSQLQPTAYYAASSGIGVAFSMLESTARNIGVIGLGVGTLAAYGRPEDTITFYEINPAVVSQATQEFTYLRRSGATIDIQVGDGRILLSQDRAKRFDLLVVDAFSGGAIPIHLMTREAFQLYAERLGEHGILALNITNTHLDLRGVVVAGAASLNRSVQVISSTGDPSLATKDALWALVLPSHQGTSLPAGDTATPPIVWSDDYHNLWSVLAIRQ